MEPTLSVETINDYIQQDNQDALILYQELVAAYQKTLADFPQEVNLLGVYFFDILKLITLSHFKVRELREGMIPRDRMVFHALNKWPYLGYADMESGFDLKQKSYGKDISAGLTGAKKLFAGIYHFSNSLMPTGEKKTGVSYLTPSVDSGEYLWRQSLPLRIKSLRMNAGWFKLPQLHEQIGVIKKALEEFLGSAIYGYQSKYVLPLIENHILANCQEGQVEQRINSDVLLLKSGVELTNRMLSVTAMQQKVKIVNIMHGEAFGVYDEPVFSVMGEQMYSNAILGYGFGIMDHQQTYQYGMNEGVSYIASPGVLSKRYYGDMSFVSNGAEFGKLKFFYYPTTLSGSSHRYGPYRDTADTVYIAWQRNMLECFGDAIYIKAHPKSKYSTEQASRGYKVCTGDFDELLDQIDVFVFDYIGTAFNIACATGKPVIYFDLGIRNINQYALELIKRRTVYFDVRNGMPDRSEILERLRNEAKDQSYSQTYSLSDTAPTRVDALVNGVEALMHN